MKTYEKSVGDLTVCASKPFPRLIDIYYRNGGRVYGLTMQDVRELHLILEEIITLAQSDED